MNQYNEANKPDLAPIKNGWAAHGDGWAVLGGVAEEGAVIERGWSKGE